MNLTKHFTLQEMTVSEIAVRRGFDNTPNATQLSNLVRTAELLEAVKEVLDMKPIIINSAFRSKPVNDAIGSRDTSQHLIGCAADIRVPGMNPDEVCRKVINSGIQYDQLIREFWDKDRGGGWTHISVPNTKDMKPRRQALIIDRSGTRPFV